MFYRILWLRYTGNTYLFDIQWCSLFISIFWSNKYLTSCNVWLISLKFISHNNLEWIQTSLDFKWFKCMIMVKPYTVWLDRLCWIKVLHVWILMSDGYVYSILDTMPFNEKRNPERTYFSTCARLLTKRKYSRMDHFFNARA